MLPRTRLRKSYSRLGLLQLIIITGGEGWLVLLLAPWASSLFFHSPLERGREPPKVWGGTCLDPFGGAGRHTQLV